MRKHVNTEPAPVLKGNPMQVAPDLYQLPVVGASVFLAMEDRITVIDAGFKNGSRRILRCLSRQGRSGAEISHIVLTHYHADHIGGVADLKEHCHACVAAHNSEIPFLETAEPLPSPFQDRHLAALTAPFVRLSEPRPFKVDLALTDGYRLDALGGMEVVHTPGHTPGSISLYFKQQGVLIVGDALECRGGKLGLPSRFFTGDMDQAKTSIRRLASLDFDVLCFSHFPPLTRNADLTLRQFADSLD